MSSSGWQLTSPMATPQIQAKCQGSSMLSGNLQARTSDELLAVIIAPWRC